MGKTVREVFVDFKNGQNILDTEIGNVNLYKKTSKLELDLKSNKKISIEEIYYFEEYLKKQFQISKVDLKFDYGDTKIENTIMEDWGKISKFLSKSFPLIKTILNDSKLEQDNKTIYIVLKTDGSNFLQSYNIDKVVEDLILKLYNVKMKVEYKEELEEDYKEKQKKYLEDLGRMEKQNIMEKNNVNAESPTVEKKEEEEKTSARKTEKNSNVILGRSANIKEKTVKIKDLTTDYGKVALEGKVITTESRELKNGKTLVIFNLYDGTSTIACKSFIDPNKQDLQEIINRINNSGRLKIQGNAQYDSFAREMGVIANVIIEIPAVDENARKDNAEKKRVELHLHTKMSQMDAMSTATDLIKRAASWGMKAIAITDHGVVQAFPEANKTVKDNKLDIKVIYGVEAYLIADEEIQEGVEDGYKKVKPYHVIILAKNYKGLRHLYELISITHLNYFHKRPRLLRSVLDKYRDGLIVGSACEQGELYRAIVREDSEERIKEIASYYDYLEIQPLGNNAFMLRDGTFNTIEELENVNKKIVELGDELGKLTVATCDVHFMDPEDEIYRRILMAGQGFQDADNQAPLFLRTTEEMINEFLYLGQEKAYEVVVTNTNKISDMCEKICPISSEKCPPVIEGAEEEIEKLCVNRAKELYGDPLPEIVNLRLKKELDSIIKNGFSTLYIIAQKLVKKSNEDGYLVGSRGSVGSSFVANMLGITEVNSLPPHYRCPKCKYSDFTDYGIPNGIDLPEKKCPKCGEKLCKDGMDIPFETFLGFNGDKEPDIDLNFSGDYQATIHKYAEVIFGKGKTFKAGTINTIKSKTAFGFVKSYFEERHIPVSNAEITRLIQGCVGVKKTTGQHPGGIIVVPHGREIYEFCPVQHPADDPDSDIITTHFEYHSIDKNLLKLDMLGHDDPTIIRMLQDLTGVDPKTIPLDDKDVISLFTSTKALGVTEEQIGSSIGNFGIPEFGTKFARDMLIDTKPTRFEELIRISGLSHGTDVWLNNCKDLINDGTVTLMEAICTRDDIMTYLIKKGLEPGDAFNIMEVVRKGKATADPEKWAKFEEIMRKHKVPEWYMESCKKIKYMFPKAHAVAYVTMALRIAWFKVHMPLAYYAAYFTVRGTEDFDGEIMLQSKQKIKDKLYELEMLGNNMTVKEKGMYTVLELVNEMIERGYEFLPIDIYKSDSKCFKIEDGKIRPPFLSIAGLGEVAAESIKTAVENEKGKFISIDEFQLKSKIGNSVIELLNKFGCLNGMHKSNQISLFDT